MSDTTAVSSTETSAEYIRFEREVLHGNIGLCDQKSGIFLAFCAAMVVYCLQALSAMPNPFSGPFWRITGHVFFIIGTMGFLGASYFSLLVIRPRLHRDARDLIFWDSSLFQLSQQEFHNALSSFGDDALKRTMQQHLYRLAAICRRKFSNMRYSMWCGEIAFVFLVAAELTQIVSK